MLIGLLKEIKNHEYRVALTPEKVQILHAHGHTVWVESHAGASVGFTDKDYEKAGAMIAPKASEIFAKTEMIVKVKEPLPEECTLLREGQILFAFLHLAANPKIADLLLNQGCIAFAYETITDNSGNLPILTPMSEIAGRLSVQAGAHFLEKTAGGRGILLGGFQGVPAAKVLILGVGNAGRQALKIAYGMGAEVTILNQSIKRLNELANFYNHDNHAEKSVEKFHQPISIGIATEEKVAEEVQESDLVIGAVLSPAAMTPKMVTRSMIKTMQKGSVVVDISIDQGGCFETSHPTTHSDPVFVEEGIIHYCVTNMPSVVPLTSTLALTNATFPYLLQLADLGYRKACEENPHLLQGLNIFKGHITHKVVAAALNKEYLPPLLSKS